ncbi:hypothetical protein C5167_041682 [Papaver somniferum]|nr:hypothetical protein C5167_041682 [Papaver somniferum]
MVRQIIYKLQFFNLMVEIRVHPIVTLEIH